MVACHWSRVCKAVAAVFQALSPEALTSALKPLSGQALSPALMTHMSRLESPLPLGPPLTRPSAAVQSLHMHLPLQFGLWFSLCPGSLAPGTLQPESQKHPFLTHSPTSPAPSVELA